MCVKDKILEHIDKHPHDAEAYVDMVDLCHDTQDHKWNIEFRNTIRRAMRNTVTREEFLKLRQADKKSLLVSAQVDLDSYQQYVEYERDPSKMFYIPRRRILRPLVQDLQDLEDRKITFLGISLPPRVGKSTECIFYLTFHMGRHPDDANVMSGHSDKLTDGFYHEVNDIITSKTEYLWADVFPKVSYESCSAKDETINLNEYKRFPSLTCRSIGGTLTGAVEISENGILYVDDLIEDLEESMNPARLDSKYDAYLNQLKDRKKDGALELMVGTRWNVFDPLGRIQTQYAGNPKYRFTVIPALDENGESNFVYDHGKGFSTEYYQDMKDSIDDASWCAKYMGHPYIREGLLFPADDLQYYNGVLPDGDHYVIDACDVAWGGGDSLSMPFAYVYDDGSVYIDDVIFSKGDKTVTRPIVVGKMKHHLPVKSKFEANNGGDEYADKVDGDLREADIHLNIFSKKAPTNVSKVTRIVQYAPDIKKWYFRDGRHRTPEYQAFMNELTLFVENGKNPHDDAPDSLAQLAEMMYTGLARCTPCQRPY